MKLYIELMKYPVFTLKNVEEHCSNKGSAKNHIGKLVSEGYVSRIKKNLYSCVSPETGDIIADKFQIASAITETSFVSHHSAMEYYGVTDQVYYDVYVSSKTRFNDFEFDDYTYKCIMTNNTSGVVTPATHRGILISNVERTVIDSLKDMNKVAGIEEVLSNIELLPLIKEMELENILNEYNNQFLYQKTGYILEKYKDKFNLSNDFFYLCKSKSGKSKRYLTNDMNCDLWNKEWQLMVPKNLMSIKNGEEYEI